jgi:hydroxymethylpyrimidine kinase/phosphomethylpyrimidine kinase/thiamine-phosphate diphosphorylase
MTKPVIMVIGGIDPQGCSGISADIRTLQALACHSMVLPTANTQQSSAGLTQLGSVDGALLQAQFADCIADVPIAAVKIGLIPSVELVHGIAEILHQLPAVPVVWDPVLFASSGGVGVSNALQQLMIEHLLPLVDVITPNLAELTQLTGCTRLEQGTQRLHRAGAKAVLVKGGDADGDFAIDFFSNADTQFYCYQTKQSFEVRGTGCVLASSLAAHLAAKQDIRDAVVLAKAYVSRGIRLSQQQGPYRLIEHSSEAIKLEDMPRLVYQQDQIKQLHQFAACPAKMGIYPVVDDNAWVIKLMDAGVETLQLRLKNQSAHHNRTQIMAAVTYANSKNSRLFINDYWQLAIETAAYGVHLGQEDLADADLAKIAAAGLRLGVSTHCYWELARALAVNPSYIALGPIFPTSSKQMPFAAQGLKRLQCWVDLLQDHYPVVAIGGITPDRVTELKNTGVSSIAMISAITQADDYQQATAAFMSQWAEP